jgi:hypothetical protein
MTTGSILSLHYPKFSLQLWRTCGENVDFCGKMAKAIEIAKKIVSISCDGIGAERLTGLD